MEDYIIDIFVEELGSQFSDITFDYMDGRRFYRVTKQDPNVTDPSIYCFIEKNTGDAYYPASWTSPAPGGPRGNISTAEDMVAALNKCTRDIGFAKR